MNNRTSRMVVLAAGLMLGATAVPAPSAAFQSPPRPDASASSVARQSADRGAGPSTALALAQRCIDPRHVALVRNAMRHGRVFTLAAARGWCDE